MSGITAMHLAPDSTSTGIPLSGAAMILCVTWPVYFRRAAVSYFPGPANANVADNIANKAIE